MPSPEMGFNHEEVAQEEDLVVKEPHLTDEEIDLIRNSASSGDAYKRTIAMSRLIARGYPEVGTKELHTSTILARELEKTLGPDNVKILLADRKAGETRFVDQTEFMRIRSERGEDIETHGVFGTLEGDDAEGPIIMIRGDMDALLTQEGVPKHMCGHNVHTAWLKMNAEILRDYKEKFGQLPFQRVIFVGEVNEEGAVSPVFGPEEMVNANMLELTGKPDIVLGAHVLAAQPEGTVSIEKEAVTASEGRFNIKLVPGPSYQGPDLEVLKSEIEFRLCSELKSEEIRGSFGTMKLVENVAEILPEELIRVSDSKSVSETERRLVPNSLKDGVSFVLSVNSHVEDAGIQEDSERNIRLIIKNSMNEFKDQWSKLGIPIEYEITPTTEGGAEFRIHTRPGHIAFGGPNVEYMGAAVIHDLYIKFGNNLKINQPVEAKEITGRFSFRCADWVARGEQHATTMQRVISETIESMGAQDIQFEFTKTLDIPPVVNDDVLRNTALGVAKKAEVEITEAGLPHMGAETFSFWEKLTKAKSLYIGVGGAGKDLFDRTLSSDQPAPEEMMHHNPKFTYQESVIPYGAFMAALAIEYGKEWEQKI